MTFSKRDQLVGPVYRRLSKNGANLKWLDAPDHLRINGGVYCYLGYSNRDRTPQQYGFAPDALETLWTDLGRDVAGYAKAFLALVYGTECVCVLKANEFDELLDPSDTTEEKFLYVKRPPGCQMRVWASTGKELNHTIPKNRFPSALLDQPTSIVLATARKR
jgi:hypothetical protein